ncbi:MAG: nitrous oxide reductase accessory protein NosL [Thiobacillus sp.]
MRRPVKRLSLVIAVFAVAAVAAALLLPGQQAARDLDLFSNDLCLVAPATPYDPASGLAMLAPRPIPADARCPVCGMYPARFSRWAAQSIFKDGAAHYFDSPLDLFVFLQDIDRYDRRYTGDVAISFVTDLESGQLIEAGNAFFVHGSTAFGPMRDADLPAFASRAAADDFIRSRNGRVLTFSQITSELIQSMNRNVPHRH